MGEFRGNSEETATKTEGMVSPEEAVEDLYQPLKIIIGKLLPRIVNGDYDLLVGDDASGRIPTLILRKVINAINDRENRSHIRTIFLAGQNSDNKKETIPTKPQLEKTGGGLVGGENTVPLEVFVENTVAGHKRALIVTDFVSTGKALEPITQELGKNMESQPDVAAILTMENDRNGMVRGTGTTIKGLVDSGYSPKPLPLVYDRTDISGVLKNIGDSFGHAYWMSEKYEGSAETVHRARVKADEIAERLIADFQS